MDFCFLLGCYQLYLLDYRFYIPSPKSCRFINKNQSHSIYDEFFICFIILLFYLTSKSNNTNYIIWHRAGVERRTIRYFLLLWQSGHSRSPDSALPHHNRVQQNECDLYFSTAVGGRITRKLLECQLIVSSPCRRHRALPTCSTPGQLSAIGR